MNDQDQRQGYNHSHSKTVKCLINIQPPYIIEKNGEYSGVIYDAWKKVKEKLPEYTFVETYIQHMKNNLEFINLINSDKYDVGIGCIATTNERINLINFTTPVIMNRCVVIYKHHYILLTTLLKFFVIYFLPYFFLLLLLSLIIGYILTKTSNQKISPARLISESVAALFGSKGSLFSHVTFNTTSIIIILILLICSTFGLQLMQGIITNIIAQSYTESEILRSTIHKYTLYGVEGSNVSEMINKNYDCKIINEHLSLEQLIEKYVKDPNTTGGIVANGMEALHYAKKYNLQITKQYFTLNQHGWVVNFNNPGILQKLNVTIRKILDTDYMGKMCKMNFGEDEGYMCIF